MSTLDRPVWSKSYIVPTYLFRSHLQRTLAGKHRAWVRMNVAADHKTMEYEIIRPRNMRERQGKRRQATDFKET